jgi:hypothetical protein
MHMLATPLPFGSYNSCVVIQRSCLMGNVFAVKILQLTGLSLMSFPHVYKCLIQCLMVVTSTIKLSYTYLSACD